MSKQVLITLLNFNNAEDTLICLQSLRNHIPKELVDILLVENSPKPSGSGQNLTDFYEIVPNKGYSHGNNIGLSKAIKDGYEYVLLLNNDTIINYDFLTPLLYTFHIYDRVGGVSPKVLFPENMQLPRKINYAGGDKPDRGRIWLPTGILQENSLEFSCIRKTDWLTGACMLLSVNAVREIGYLNEFYFLYYEDVDWCLRALKKNYNLIYNGKVEIQHHESKSTSNVRLFYFKRSFLFLTAIHFPNELVLVLKRYYSAHILHNLVHKDFKSFKESMVVIFSFCKILITFLLFRFLFLAKIKKISF